MKNIIVGIATGLFITGSVIGEKVFSCYPYGIPIVIGVGFIGFVMALTRWDKLEQVSRTGVVSNDIVVKIGHVGIIFPGISASVAIFIMAIVGSGAIVREVIFEALSVRL